MIINFINRTVFCIYMFLYLATELTVTASTRLLSSCASKSVVP